jgi:hypothetical protein
MIRTIHRVWQRLGLLGRPQPLALAPGVYVVASNPRHANWLWMQAVEHQVSAALMTQIVANRGRQRSQLPFQLHLLA